MQSGIIGNVKNVSKTSWALLACYSAALGFICTQFPAVCKTLAYEKTLDLPTLKFRNFVLTALLRLMIPHIGHLYIVAVFHVVYSPLECCHVLPMG